MRKVKAASLVLDFDLYPRNNVDSHNVRSIADAIAAGETMPPAIVDKKSQRVVDGFHRVRAVLIRDPEGEIEIIEKEYKNDRELFVDAMRYNSQHGARLDPCDRVHCTLIAERLSIPLAAVAGALHMPVERLGVLQTRRATVSGGLQIALKRTISHMEGKRMTKAQSEVNDKLSGMNQAFYVNQIIMLIESKMIDTSDEKLMARLERLDELLDEVLVKA